MNASADTGSGLTALTEQTDHLGLVVTAAPVFVVSRTWFVDAQSTQWNLPVVHTHGLVICCLPAPVNERNKFLPRNWYNWYAY